jgi:ABC-type dipeptide/oligopeptide/nickel transport system permease component
LRELGSDFFVFALILAFVFILSRSMIRSLPGDPLETLVAETATNVPREELRQELGLDRPFWSAVAQDLRQAVVHGDLGISLFTRQQITPLIGERFLKTIQLTLAALALGLCLSLTIGLLAAAGIGDRFCTLYGGVTAALPTPWIGPILIYLLSVWLPVLPPRDHIVLPALTLAIGFSGTWSRLIRQRVRESLAVGAARGARARGVSEFTVLLKYGLAPVSGALIAYLGTQLGFLLAGAFVTEVIFNWPGLGSLFVNAVLSRDYTVVEAAAFVGAATSLFGTALGDLIKFYFIPEKKVA